jgi:hypothetical protein
LCFSELYTQLSPASSTGSDFRLKAEKKDLRRCLG